MRPNVDSVEFGSVIIPCSCCRCSKLHYSLISKLYSTRVKKMQFFRVIHVAGWSAILSRRSLRSCNEKLRLACTTCRQLGDSAVPCVVSACVISTELHPNIHIMIDTVKPDDSQRARRQMSTPSDTSCTHILVFPTSATAQVTY